MDQLPTKSVIDPTKSSRAIDRRARDSLRFSEQNYRGTRLAPRRSTIVGVITAGRRECWGSHTDGAEGHRNHAMPFCFVLINSPGDQTHPAAPRGDSRRLPPFRRRPRAKRSGSHRHASAATCASLADFFTPGAVFQDRNGDGAIDFVDARIVLARASIAAELAAAADVGARLGFETSAMNLPLCGRRPTQPADGRRSEKRPRSTSAPALASSSGHDARLRSCAAGLKAGDGVVAAFGPPTKPSSCSLGGDEDGLERRGCDARRSLAVRLGSERTDHRQDRRRRA